MIHNDWQLLPRRLCRGRRRGRFLHLKASILAANSTATTKPIPKSRFFRLSMDDAPLRTSRGISVTESRFIFYEARCGKDYLVFQGKQSGYSATAQHIDTVRNWYGNDQEGRWPQQCLPCYRSGRRKTVSCKDQRTHASGKAAGNSGCSEGRHAFSLCGGIPPERRAPLGRDRFLCRALRWENAVAGRNHSSRRRLGQSVFARCACPIDSI